MAREAVNYSVRLDSELKRQSEIIFAELGLTLSAAINAFLRESVREGGIPFEMRLKPAALANLDLDAPEETTGSLSGRVLSVAQ